MALAGILRTSYMICMLFATTMEPCKVVTIQLTVRTLWMACGTALMTAKCRHLQKMKCASQRLISFSISDAQQCHPGQQTVLWQVPQAHHFVTTGFPGSLGADN
ncbi:unnamed protein product, partial [Staurois parvus]